MKNVFYLISLLILFVACKSGQKQNGSKEDSLPWKTEWYIGVLPLGTETIKTELKLIYPEEHYGGGSYLLMETHYGDRERVEIQNGKWSLERGNAVNKDASVIALYSSNDSTVYARYTLDNQKMILLDSKAYPMKGDYILYLKQNSEDVKPK